MIERLDPVTHDRSLPVTPQLAMRVAMLGVVAFVMFAIIFFRLWYLQVLSGDQYRAQATDNRVRNLQLPAPRGSILDRNGRILVTSTQATVIQISPSRLPDAERQAAAKWVQDVVTRDALPKGQRRAPIPIPPPKTPALAKELTRLGHVIGEKPADIQETIIRSLVQLPYAAVTIKIGVPASERNYLLERQAQFPSIDPPALAPVRDYPKGDLAAQLMGTVGQITKKQLLDPSFHGVLAGTAIGQTGIEGEYDHYLRGTNGVQRYVVDAQGNPKGSPRTPHRPLAGDVVQLTIDGGLQRAGQDALEQGMRDAQALANPGVAGAFVALDPTNGQVLAMGSAPTYRPKELARTISQTRYNRLFGKNSGSPLLNRAITSVYPTGSTFKPITALAALSTGVVTPDQLIDDPGCITIAKKAFCDAGSSSAHPIAAGSVDLVDALKVSSDVYFYSLGQWLNKLPHQPLQRWARRLGLANTTGIDLPGEATGTVPDRAWRRKVRQEEIDYEKVHHNRCPPDCVISDKRAWSVGDEVNLATGQGDLQASPLQMAVAYSALANGGTVITPHVARTLLDSEGRELRQISPPPAHHIAMNPDYRNLILEGLHEAASQPDGTSGTVFAGWNQDRFPVYGKTGTAQRFYGPANAQVEHDQSWYVAYSYDSQGANRKPIVIAMTIEQGGFGAEAAAPAVCLMLNHWFGQHAACKPGNSHTR